ncbi:BsuBI/PstI family type II restriction endonuclease [Rothia mucilaginosa]
MYVSCFPNRQVLRSHLVDIAWETEVWLESDPTHMIHFNGSRFMGPYES